VHLLLAGDSADADTPVVVYTHTLDGGVTWRKPIRLSRNDNAPYAMHRGNDVQIAASGGDLIAAWQTAGTGYGGGGPMTTAISADGGESWHKGSNPADDGSTDAHGFIDLAADPDGNFHLVWLDNRNGAQGLYYARSKDGGKLWSQNIQVDKLTCECCWNQIKATGPDNLYVLYRDIHPRDMRMAISSNKGRTWNLGGRVGRFSWNFDGCPHAGGGIASIPTSSGDSVLHAVVWTGLLEQPGLYYLASADNGRTWTDPAPLGELNALHADISARNADHIAAVWDARVGSNVIFAARSRDGGESWEAGERLSSRNVEATHPRIVSTPDGFRVFWTETHPRKGGVLALAPF